ncbi:hypothetical protein MML48_2g00007709 [Holotrichia oblita]|uniref:Uncharacterized protein n=1 Tax=Holotrichia oblita TaxID=644536 RepID=A0ACB9TKQ5_HOLOL|nr:hypothetical protein MML48_2g00007709 [Holotrichia oblita]
MCSLGRNGSPHFPKNQEEDAYEDPESSDTDDFAQEPVKPERKNMMHLKYAFFYLTITTLQQTIYGNNLNNNEDENDRERHVIEGKVFPLDVPYTQPNWQANTRIHVNGGEYLGFVKEDGTFVIHNIPSGSYIVEALNSELTYELVRVEINSKGKFRARRDEQNISKYEQWRVTDFLLNPMVLMMVLPLLLIMVLPKMMNDPETKKEMEQFGSLKFPGVSDMVTNIFAGAPPNPQQPKKALKTKKRQ